MVSPAAPSSDADLLVPLARRALPIALEVQACMCPSTLHTKADIQHFSAVSLGQCPGSPSVVPVSATGSHGCDCFIFRVSSTRVPGSAESAETCFTLKFCVYHALQGSASGSLRALLCRIIAAVRSPLATTVLTLPVSVAHQPECAAGTPLRPTLVPVASGFACQ